DRATHALHGYPERMSKLPYCIFRVKQIRAKAMMNKAELARKAQVSVLTITRIEQGMECRMDTRRRIIQALGYKIEERKKGLSRLIVVDLFSPRNQKHSV
ncbi:MAG: helix-turn-helix transcriptional regulator, partial [bacterium]